MKIKTSELTGPALDWAVAQVEGATNLRYDTIASWWFKLNGKDRTLSSGWSAAQSFNPSTDWAQGGPLSEREGISTRHLIGWEGWGKWDAKDPRENHLHFGPTPLIAAMRCYVASKLGDEIDIPEELCAK